MRPHSMRGGPDGQTLLRLVEQDQLSDRQIGEMYGGVSEAAVRYWRMKHHVTRPSTQQVSHRASGAIPWVLNARKGHAQDSIARFLRARGRREAGQPVPPDVLRRVQNFEAELDKAGVVINYDPDTEQGFYFVPRDNTRDDPRSVVRQPDR